MMKFRSNQNIRTDFKGGNLKVISQQNRSTPGIVLKVSLHRNSIYRIKLNGYRASPNTNIYLLISDINYRKIFDYDNLLNMYNNIKIIEFNTGNFVKRSILIYILFKNPQVNDYFILDYFTIYDQYDNVVLDYNFNIQVYEDNSEELYNYFNDKQNMENNVPQNITKDLNIRDEKYVENISTNEIENEDEKICEEMEEVKEIVEEVEEIVEEVVEEVKEKNEETENIGEIEENKEIIEEKDEEKSEEKDEEIEEIEKNEEIIEEIIEEKDEEKEITKGEKKRENKKNNGDKGINDKKSEKQNSKKEKRGRKKKEINSENVLDQIIEEEIKKNLDKKDKDKKAKVIRYDGGHFYNDEDKNVKKEKKDEKKEEKRGKSKREIKKEEKDDKKKGESRRGRKKKEETNSENNLKKWVKFS